MDFSPLLFGIGTACIGTILVFILILLVRSCFCVPSSSTHTRHLLRSNGNGTTATTTPAHCEKDPHGGSLMMMSHSTNNSNSLNNSYRQFPLSKNEMDTNPDIIPGDNNFPGAGK